MKLKIGHTHVEVVTRTQVTTEGEYDGHTGNIFLADTLRGDQREVILLHEALHGLFDFTGLNKHDELGEDIEEEIVLRLAPALMMFMRDNKNWIKKVLDP